MFIQSVYFCYWLQQPLNDLQHGQVSAAEVVQAVHEMLSAAGISMDTEKQSLLQMTLTLQEQLKESQVALLLEQVSSLRHEILFMESSPPKIHHAMPYCT